MLETALVILCIAAALALAGPYLIIALIAVFGGLVITGAFVLDLFDAARSKTVRYFKRSNKKN